MGKIHQIVAVEKDVKGSFNKILGETRHTFTSKSEHFEEHLKEYSPKAVQDDGQQEALEELDRDFKPMVTTVPEKLDYFFGPLKRRMDLIIQKEVANASASADLTVVDDNGVEQVLYTSVPVAALVQLSNLLQDVRNGVLGNIPTLEPQRKWTLDNNRENVYVSDVIHRNRTKKMNVPLVLHPGTDKHQPQVQLVTEDVTTGKWATTYWSGKISSARKSKILRKCDLVLAGLKKAIAVANEAEVSDVHIADSVVAFVMSD